MTIITTQSRITYAGDNVTVLFPIPFEFFLNTDITVVKTAVGGGVATLVLNIDYTLSGANVPGGGSATKTTPLLTGETLALFLNPPISQQSHYISNSPFPSATLENDIDRQTQISQRLADILSRSLHAPDGDPAAGTAGFTLPSSVARANTFLTFDANGNPVPAVTLPSGTLSQSSIGLFLYPQTPAEAAASVTPTNYFYAPYNVNRYGTNTTPGTTDMTAAVNNADKAATQAGAAMYVPGGTYGISLTGVTRNGCSWMGDGPYASIVKSLAVSYVTTVTGMITITSKNNWTVENIGFDVSAATFAPGAGNPGNIFWIFSAVTCNNWTVQNCAFTGLQAHTIGVAVNGGSNFVIEENYFNMPVASSAYNQSINISVAAGAVNAHYVRRNVMIGTGYFSNGAYGLIEGNVSIGTGFGSALACGPLAACIGNRFIGNICSGTVGTDINGFTPDGIQCWSIDGVVVGNYCYKNSGNGILVGGPNSTVAGNVCYDNSQVSAVSCGITLISSAISSASNCTVTGNRCFDDQGSPTQVYGIAESVNGLAITGNVITGNSSTGNKTANYIYSGTPAPGLQYTAGQMQINAAMLAPAGGSISVGLLMTGTFAQGIFIGSGAPTLAAAQGALYIRTDGSSTSTRLYVSTAGSGWTNVVTAT